jgi:Spy/CpxP family protein refolding chaperone
MKTTRVSRPIPIALTALVAFFSALAALAVSNGLDMAQAHGNHARAPMKMTMSAHSSSAQTAKAVALRTDMRKLWEDHITWTRLAIISLESGTPDTNATVARLLRNQVDIGNAIKPYYGKAAGNELTRQLRAHILIAADVIAAAKAGASAELADAQPRWVKNANQIATVLHSVNPRYWKLGAMKAEMHRHLDLTTQEAVARLQGNWTADVAAYDKVHQHILHMSDMLSQGISKQFPAGFR